MLLILLFMGFVPTLYAAQVVKVPEKIPKYIPIRATRNLKNTLYTESHTLKCYEIDNDKELKLRLEIRRADGKAVVIITNSKKENIAFLFSDGCDETIGNGIRVEGDKLNVLIKDGRWYRITDGESEGIIGQQLLKETSWALQKPGGSR
ncbi:uncharacterized protein LOC128996033 [Macrosteles quadrilineatus]|uniref:uncharacterized protein LOC128996033 n=1 Tax=Macrosteles quadrilineatus TaxID=74068 RepID=UPI0023E1E682|nr:uncharacterized protein LOC128996033 [Macrosteles quadrilineatus]